MKQYVLNVINNVIKDNPGETEFHATVKEVLTSLVPVLDKNPHYAESAILERLVEPERIISFRVPWVNDSGKIIVNKGYRVQFNSSLGPYKGGLRFHPSVNLSIIKFLGFEQIFKNSLTGLPLGGAKGGANFDPKGKSDNEIMRFCQSFMTELSHHIGHDNDIPAGDIGVGSREIGYLFGQYKRLRNSYEAGVLTGKGLGYWGSLARKEATGYGLLYFLKHLLNDNNFDFKDKKVIVSGSGNVAIYAMEKALEFGAKVIACSDSSGFIHDPEGIDLNLIKKIKEVKRGRIFEYLKTHSHATYSDNSGSIWGIKCDIALPCATQGELNLDDAKKLVSNKVLAIGEGANMPCSLDAINYFINNKVLFAPAKAANAGGVSVSALEMSQNAMRYSWTFEEVDKKLHNIMEDIYLHSKTAAEKYGFPGNLLIGSNITGFIKVADAMLAHGII